MLARKRSTAGAILGAIVMGFDSGIDRLLKVAGGHLTPGKRPRPGTNGVKEGPQVGARQVARYKRQGLHTITVNGREIMQQAKTGEAQYAENDGQSVEAFRAMRDAQSGRRYGPQRGFNAGASAWLV